MRWTWVGGVRWYSSEERPLKPSTPNSSSAYRCRRRHGAGCGAGGGCCRGRRSTSSDWPPRRCVEASLGRRRRRSGGRKRVEEVDGVDDGLLVGAGSRLRPRTRGRTHRRRGRRSRTSAGRPAPTVLAVVRGDRRMERHDAPDGQSTAARLDRQVRRGRPSTCRPRTSRWRPAGCRRYSSSAPRSGRVAVDRHRDAQARRSPSDFEHDEWVSTRLSKVWMPGQPSPRSSPTASTAGSPGSSGRTG